MDYIIHQKMFDMKKAIVIVLLAATVPAMAQKLSSEKVPAAAKTAFEKTHPGITDVKWEKEKSNFEVNYTEGGIKTSVVYNDKGELLETEYAMDVKHMQQPISKYIETHYAGGKVKEFTRVDRPGKPANYEVVIGSKELVFGPNGQFIKEAAAD